MKKPWEIGECDAIAARCRACGGGETGFGGKRLVLATLNLRNQ